MVCLSVRSFQENPWSAYTSSTSFCARNEQALFTNRPTHHALHEFYTFHFGITLPHNLTNGRSGRWEYCPTGATSPCRLPPPQTRPVRRRCQNFRWIQCERYVPAPAVAA